MTFTVADWPSAAPVPDTAHPDVWGFAAVWRRELTKLSRLVRVQAVLAVCLVAPFLVAAGISVQDAVPADTLFGQWVHESGFAVSMVVLGFAGQWMLPLVVAVVAGDIFSGEDHHGTWKMLLTRSRSRVEMFSGKALAVLTYTVVALVLVAAASLGAAFVLGAHPVIGLGGQLVPAREAARLVIGSWALQLPPMIGFATLAMLFSIASRNSVVGIGAPVLVGLVFQLLTLVDLPARVRIAMLGTPFQSWHGLWVARPYYGPIWNGLLTSGVWIVVCGLLGWLVFSLRGVRISS